MDTHVLPPETLEGWYALHQLFAVDRGALRALPPASRAALKHAAAATLAEVAAPGEGGSGWSAVVPLVGSAADVMLVHFRSSLDDVGAVQRRLACEPLFDRLRPVYSFLSVAEAGMYHLTAKLAKEAAARGGSVGDEVYREQMGRRLEAERTSAHVQKRLQPPLPADMPYVCFYPMSKKRESGQNWYTLSLDERSQLMYAHGMTGRRYAGRVFQVITGAIGFEAWEWGVTLFARDPLDFKKLVSEMRFDEASARYADFGAFYVGRMDDAEHWLETLP